ncbi:MAG: M48 family metallopeptidase [Gammaproteobacteria bacterium]|nr:M48 family metallopeptidase [Gammaproteobacteria bacterium]
MDFYKYQDKARHNSWILTSLFTFAVAGLLIITTLFVAALVAYSRGQVFDPRNIGELLGWNLVIIIAAAISGIIILGSVYKWHQLTAGGHVVAESLGGRKINAAPEGRAELRALNVVEEMSIACGIPMPDVYILDDKSINAFVAGYNSKDAVIGLTRGCIEQLNREELQGVVAHELSHIFNGDMHMNIRIAGLLYGIMMISLLGIWLLTYSDRGSRSRILLLFVAIGLVIIGYTGNFFANLIKYAVSRQREFLADASAVQFSRNSAGIAGALKKIGGCPAGSRLQSNNAAEFSHMYFASGLKKSLNDLLSTHPPLAARIARLDPRWDGRYRTPIDSPPGLTVPEAQNSQVLGVTTAQPKFDSNSVTEATKEAPLQSVIDTVQHGAGNPDEKQISYARTLLQKLPSALKLATRDPFAAQAMVYHLLQHHNRTGPQRQQLQKLLQKIAHPGVLREMRRFASLMKKLGVDCRLPLLDLCIPALKTLMPPQHALFKRNLRKLLHFECQAELWEWSLYRVLMHALEPRVQHPTIFNSASATDNALRFLLAVVAHAEYREYLPAKRSFIKGLSALQLAITPLPAATDIALPKLDKSLAILSQLKPLQKPRLLKVLATTMARRDAIKAGKIELLRAIADGLDCPMPPIVNNLTVTSA